MNTADAELDPFDQDIDDAFRSSALAELFRSAFDDSAPPGMLGFSFVTMAGLTRIVDLMKPDPPAVVLDAGCGWGGPGLWIAQRLGSRLIGIDSSRVGIALAHRRAAEWHQDASFAVAPIEATGQETASIDAAISIDALHFAGDADAAARELFRVVRPGGLLIATLWQTDAGPERFTRDHAAVLRAAGWSVEAEEAHPDWLEAQLRLYEAAAARGSLEPDPAVRRLQREGLAVTPFIRLGRRILIVARRPA